MSKKLEKVVRPCDKEIVTADELLVHCGGCYPIVISEKHDASPVEDGLVAVSRSESGKLLNFCVFRQRADGKFESVIRFSLVKVHFVQLGALTEG